MSKRMAWRVALMAGGAMIVATGAQAQTAQETTAQAADQPATETATAAADDEGGDQAIVITARRTEENI